MMVKAPGGNGLLFSFAHHMKIPYLYAVRIHEYNKVDEKDFFIMEFVDRYVTGIFRRDRLE